MAEEGGRQLRLRGKAPAAHPIMVVGLNVECLPRAVVVRLETILIVAMLLPHYVHLLLCHLLTTARPWHASLYITHVLAAYVTEPPQK
jgi:hypothetical protein